MTKQLKEKIDSKKAIFPDGIVKMRKNGGATFTYGGYCTWFGKYGELEGHLLT